MIALATTRPPVDYGSPEWRAALFGQAVAYAAHLTGPICPVALHRHLRTFAGRASDAREDEVCDAVLMLVETGLFTCNTVDEVTGEIVFTDRTTLTVAPMLTGYLYGEDSGR